MCCMDTDIQFCYNNRQWAYDLWFLFQRSPLSTQDQNIMTNTSASKPGFISKLRPPSAIKRPRELTAITNTMPITIEVIRKQLFEDR